MTFESCLFVDGCGTVREYWDTVPDSCDNVAVTADAGPSSSGAINGTITLMGSGTGTNITFLWSLESGEEVDFADATSALTTITAAEAGIRVLKITVTDENGNTATDVVTKTFSLPAISVNAGSDQLLNLPTTSATLIATGTGVGLVYEWTQLSGDTVATIDADTSATTGISGLSESEDEAIFQVTVTDDYGQTATDTVTITSQVASGFLARWAWFDDDAFKSDIDGITWAGSGTFASGAPIIANFKPGSSVPRYFVMDYPDTEDDYDGPWINTPLNSGPFLPDSVWDMTTNGDKKLIWTRDTTGLDPTQFTTFTQ